MVVLQFRGRSVTPVKGNGDGPEISDAAAEGQKRTVLPMAENRNSSLKRLRRLLQLLVPCILCALVPGMVGLALVAGSSNAAAASFGAEEWRDPVQDYRLDVVQARNEQTGQSGISSPEQGGSVSGPVPIMGTATGSPFARYELSFKESSRGDEAYSYFGGETRQVVNGQLGVWHTDVLAPGTYTLRLRVVRPDGNYGEFFVHNISVRQDPITPTPDEPTSTPIPIDTPTPYPQPTVAEVRVEQPNIEGATEDEPTATPPPAQDDGSGASDIQTSPSTQSEIDPQPGILGDLGESLGLENLRAQFFTGVRWSAGLFLLLGAVFAAKRLLEWLITKNE